MEEQHTDGSRSGGQPPSQETAMTDASGYAEAGDTIEVPVADWLAMHRRIGFAEGLLWGWLYAGDDVAQARDATAKFLEKAHD